MSKHAYEGSSCSSCSVALCSASVSTWAAQESRRGLAALGGPPGGRARGMRARAGRCRSWTVPSSARPPRGSCSARRPLLSRLVLTQDRPSRSALPGRATPCHCPRRATSLPDNDAKGDGGAASRAARRTSPSPSTQLSCRPAAPVGPSPSAAACLLLRHVSALRSAASASATKASAAQLCAVIACTTTCGERAQMDGRHRRVQRGAVGAAAPPAPPPPATLQSPAAAPPPPPSSFAPPPPRPRPPPV